MVGANPEPLVMFWKPSHRFDRRSVAIADRHYNRQKPGSPQFVPPGRCMVLRHGDVALWVTSWQFAEYTRHRWAGAWVNSLFRNESSRLSSELIVEAVAHTRAFFGDPPQLGMVTFVDAGRVASRNPGYCYECAGFVRDGQTQGGLVAWRMLPEAMPEPLSVHNQQLRLL